MAWCQAHARAVYCTQNKYTSISIHTFVRYMLKKSLVTKRCTGFLCFVEIKFRPRLRTGRHFFEAITDISSDAESRELRHLLTAEDRNDFLSRNKYTRVHDNQG